MAYEPLTEEQYNKAIDSGLSHEQIIQFEQLNHFEHKLE